VWDAKGEAVRGNREREQGAYLAWVALCSGRPPPSFRERERERGEGEEQGDRKSPPR